MAVCKVGLLREEGFWNWGTFAGKAVGKNVVGRKGARKLHLSCCVGTRNGHCHCKVRKAHHLLQFQCVSTKMTFLVFRIGKGPWARFIFWFIKKAEFRFRQKNSARTFINFQHWSYDLDSSRYKKLVTRHVEACICFSGWSREILLLSHSAPHEEKNLTLSLFVCVDHNSAEAFIFFP